MIVPWSCCEARFSEGIDPRTLKRFITMGHAPGCPDPAEERVFWPSDVVEFEVAHRGLVVADG